MDLPKNILIKKYEELHRQTEHQADLETSSVEVLIFGLICYLTDIIYWTGSYILWDVDNEYNYMDSAVAYE